MTTAKDAKSPLEMANEWWDGMSPHQRKEIKAKKPGDPTDTELLAAYHETHKTVSAGQAATQQPSKPGSKAPTTPTKAKDWWRNLPPKERDTFTDGFKDKNTPTDEELVKVYDEAHNNPPTPARAKAWWDGLGLEEQRILKAKHLDQPSDEEIITLYEAAHKTAADEPPRTGTEPPQVSPATPYASATNPELMKNDVEAGPGVPYYDRQVIPEEIQEQMTFPEPKTPKSSQDHHQGA